MSSEVLRTERVGGALLLTIDRPDAGNAISAEVSAALEEALTGIDRDRGLRAVVITGAGGKFFCSGGDIKQYRQLRTEDELEAAFARPRRVLDTLEALPVPVIAAVNGYALGGGAELMLACDIRLAAPGATIGFPYVRLGLIAGWHGIERLARNCGYGTAIHLLATGEPVPAVEAQRLGLVNRVVTEKSVADAGLELAERFADAAPLALAASKQVLQSAYHLPRGEARILATEAFAKLWLSEDHREAEAAFAEKRSPRFRGK
ncbi:MAG: enoyl-CoA hydratase/isomerase family protein [Candidatus Methylomirabilia bacterium]